MSIKDLHLLKTLKDQGPEAGLFGACHAWPDFDDLTDAINKAIADRHHDKGRTAPHLPTPTSKSPPSPSPTTSR